jgi:WD40 repeat protein
MPLLSIALIALSQTPTASASPLTISSKVIQGVRPLAFAASPDGSKMAMTLEDNSVRIMDIGTRTTIRTLVGHPQPAYAVAWSSDGTYIATGDESARIFIWNALTGVKVRTLMGHIRGIQKLSFNNSRSLLMSDGNDDVINVWNVTSGKKVGTILGKGLNEYGATFAPKTDNILVGLLSGTGGARTYRMTPEGPKFINFLTYTNPTSQPHGVFDVCYSPDAKRAVTAGNDGHAIVWDTFSYKKIGILAGHDDFVRRVAYSPNGKVIATSSNDRTVRLWDANSLKQIGEIPDESGVSSPLAFTADGKYLVSVNVEDYLQVNALTPAQGGKMAPAGKVKPVVKKWRRKH